MKTFHRKPLKNFRCLRQGIPVWPVPAGLLLLLLLILLPATARGTDTGRYTDFPADWPVLPDDWPVLKHYDADHVDRIALPLGGIGTGTVSLGGRGNLRDWEIMNRPAKGYNPGPRFDLAPFFVLFTEAGDKKDTRLLEGPVPLYEYEGSRGVNRVPNHGMPRFEKTTFDAAYPFGQVNLFHDELPVKVRIKGFNPLVPADVDKSSIPLAALTFEVVNTSGREVDASVCFSMQNFIGEDGFSGTSLQNKNEFRQGDGQAGIFMSSEGVDPGTEQWGTMAVTTSSRAQITYRTGWRKADWGAHLLDFWDDFSADGTLEERPMTGEDKPMASLAVKVRLAPGEKKEIDFFITWHFPNRKAWSYTMLRNYYTGVYRDAWDVALKTLPELEQLEEETAVFVDAFLASDLPLVVKEAALFNISTLRTQTCFRTSDGYFFSWEGYHDNAGSSWGSCTHVYNYEHATGFLFGELARLKREIEFGLATDSGGLMSFRVRLPLDSIPNFKRAAADGQMGAIMKMYRDWQLSGDDRLLRELYPAVKRAMQFCWIKGGWDADMDGVMEGAQHNTMDVEYFGPNPQMGFWYLGALRATEEMAGYLGDREFADLCSRLFAQGSRWMDEHLFNGEYYIHLVQPPERVEDIHPSLVVGMGGDNLLDPEYQLGEGCLVDQLVGQYVAHLLGLGYLGDREHMVTTLESILKYNHRESLQDHFNCLRTYALGDEAALLMADYPRSRPLNPFPYFTEVMTGFEYAAAVGMLYEGMEQEGLRCIQNIRDRYDGFKRNPFDEAEWGHHYGRAMASWSAVLALTGFRYSAVEKTMAFNPLEGTYFWSNGYRYGTVEIRDEGKHMQVTLKPVNGELVLNSFALNGYGHATFSGGIIAAPDRPAGFRVEKKRGEIAERQPDMQPEMQPERQPDLPPEQNSGEPWPLLKTYEGKFLDEVAMPLGGIGTGTVSIGGRGDLRDWELMNRGALGFVPAFKLVPPTICSGPFFALYYREPGKDAMIRVLEGPVPVRDYYGDWGAEALNAGFPRFGKTLFSAAYPLARVEFIHRDVPLEVRLEAFNPLIMGDADQSGIPVAVLRYVLTNPTDHVIEAAVCGMVLNYIGTDGWTGEPEGNRNLFRAGEGLQGVYMYSEGVDPLDVNWGTMALTTTAPEGVTFRTSWAGLPWNWTFREFWDDFIADGELTDHPETMVPAHGDNDPETGNGAATTIRTPPATLAAKVTLAPGESRRITFLLTWHFPNRRAWDLGTGYADSRSADYGGPEIVGNYYATLYGDAWDVAERMVSGLEDLERETVKFVGALVKSDIPAVIREAALFNLNHLRSQTMFRTADGMPFGFEGTGSVGGTRTGGDRSSGWGFGTCSHVWHYESAIPFLFGDLSLKFREVEFMHATGEDGGMSFRVGLPLETRARNYRHRAADGQMGTLVKMYRDWQLSGDDEKLRQMWPQIKKAMAYAWTGPWDRDRDGVMEGEQHNTMDVSYYGPNPQMAGWYLAALRASEEMATRLGDKAFARDCRILYGKGRSWVDSELFNGEYYEQRIPEGISTVGQLGGGCLVDQLAGQYLAQTAGLGYVLDPDHVRTTLGSIMKYNFVENFNDHFNTFRSFGLGDEAGLIMAGYPEGKLLDFPFPYYTEVMTGFEYSTAAHMLYEGQAEAGLKVYEAVRDRFDGHKRNPFNEGEYGHRYARALSAWAGIPAFTGFRYSAVEKTMAFNLLEGTYFWSNGYRYGTVEIRDEGNEMSVVLTCLNGDLHLDAFDLNGYGTVTFPEGRVFARDCPMKFTVPGSGSTLADSPENNL